MPPRDMYAGPPPRYSLNSMPPRPMRHDALAAHGMPYGYSNAPMYGAPPSSQSAPSMDVARNGTVAPSMPMPNDASTTGPSYDANASSTASTPHGPTPTVYLATYSSVPVYEITVRGIALMRRRSDGYLNATQILKIAGIEKARRTRILEKEILTGEHDKVQGGYGTFQGTWIPLQRAQELAINYSVYHLIRPLLDFDPSASQAVTAPGPQGVKRKADASASAPKHTPAHGTSTAPLRAATQQPRFMSLKPPRAHDTLPTSAGGLLHTLPLASDEAGHAPDGTTPSSTTSTSQGVPPGSHPAQRSALGAYATHGYVPQGVPLPTAAATEATTTTTTTTAARVPDLNALSSGTLQGAIPPSESAAEDVVDHAGPRFADKAVPPRLGDERERRARDLLTGLFVHEPQAPNASLAPLDRLQALLRELGPDAPRRARSPLNLVIDDHGHTALHWAAALCRLPLVRMLTALPPAQGGANIYVGNYAGETALHRSVLVTNAYELSQFPDLLDLLAGSLETRDHRKRTVLHHIALVAGLKGRAAPARYYLGCVLERLALHTSMASSLLDAQDDEGETALSIAARLGNTNMIKMLLDAGARKDLPNYLGITPLDWGISQSAHDEPASAPTPVPSTSSSSHATQGVLQELGSYRASDVVRSLTNPPPGPVKKSQDVREKLVQTLDELQSIFDREVSTKQEAIETTQTHLQAATRELAARRRDMAAAQAAVTEREEQRQRCENLTQALSTLPTPAADEATTPTWTQPIWQEAEAALAQPTDAALAAALVRLRWLMQYLAHATRVQTQAQAERHQAAEARQRKYHQVVAMCAQVPPDKVDGMLDELLAAVESIGSDVDMSSVASFMHKVGRAQAGMEMHLDPPAVPSG